ncbi:MAG: Wzz/FepE/Etk N-terminal domain-containing protein [Alphaproteobacteria bacterium]
MEDEDLFEGRSLAEYWACFRRRKSFIAITAGLIVLAALVLALILPPVYASTATILIEEPEVPDSLVPTTISRDPEQRLRSVEQRVMTTQNLMQIVSKFNLFARDRESVPASDLAERIRKHTTLKLVNSDDDAARRNPQNSELIAFTLAYDAHDPVVAQQVAGELVTLYLSENARTRQAQAVGTVGFLSSRSDELSSQIRALEAKIADFKTKNAGSLPDDYQPSLQMLSQAQGQITQLLGEQQSAREMQAALQAQLSQIDPNLSVAGPNGQPILSGEALVLQYQALSAKLGENHPQVVSTRRQLQEMGIDPSTISRGALLSQQSQLKQQIADASKSLGPENPQVQALKRELAEVESKLRSAGSAKPSATVNATNPAYVQIQSQLAATTSRLESFAREEDTLRARISDLNQRISREPEVERAYADLKRTYDDAVARYQELTSKRSEAELSSSLETERKGEKFSVIEPPDLPDHTAKPVRKMVLLIGMILAGVAGLGGAIGLDAISGRIYGRRQLARAFGALPLIAIPAFASPAARARQHPWDRLGPWLGKALKLVPRWAATSAHNP